METLGYVHICLLYEQDDEPQLRSLSPIASTMTVMLAASVASATLLTDHTSVAARYVIYRPYRQEPIFAPEVPKTTNLQVGSQGAQVREIQMQLRNWGFPLNPANRLVVDGVFGAQTQTAVREFQAYRGLNSDGIVGPKTKDALFTPRSTNVFFDGEMLMLGSEGDRVSELQRRLYYLGWYGDVLQQTGVFDPQTDIALREFQSLANLNPDGIFGPQTANAMGQICAANRSDCNEHASYGFVAWRERAKGQSKFKPKK